MPLSQRTQNNDKKTGEVANEIHDTTQRGRHDRTRTPAILPRADRNRRLNTPHPPSDMSTKSLCEYFSTDESAVDELKHALRCLLRENGKVEEDYHTPASKLDFRAFIIENLTKLPAFVHDACNNPSLMDFLVKLALTVKARCLGSVRRAAKAKQNVVALTGSIESSGENEEEEELNNEEDISHQSRDGDVKNTPILTVTNDGTKPSEPLPKRPRTESNPSRLVNETANIWIVNEVNSERHGLCCIQDLQRSETSEQFALDFESWIEYAKTQCGYDSSVHRLEYQSSTPRITIPILTPTQWRGALSAQTNAGEDHIFYLVWKRGVTDE
ncbi:hypothetical protein PHISCL_04968 [Aspergillus sclerotialis]|uniref:Uncharacterized protein n=1 Tax=Aspergillus sclerotialis TaxID=2070753 RepID=A0A3A2ZMT2_9EURO|nr:hypothetical protein PHISCL_04968 [Aspergillus sclerotialis]